MTPKTQWLLCGAVLSAAVVGAWALVRYAGLGAPTPVGPTVLNPAPPQANRGNPESPPTPVNPVNTPPIPGQAVLPFGNSGGGGGQTAGQAAVPNFGSRGPAGGAGGGGASLPAFGALPAGNNRGAAPVSGGASVPTFGDPPAAGNNRGGAAPAGGGGGAGGAGGAGARLPFDINNAVAVATPTDNRPPATPTGGAVMPSFVTGGTGTAEPGRGGAGGAAGGAAPGAPSSLITGAALVPPFMIDQTDPNAIAKHYLKQLCGDRVPTLADWQKLADLKLPDAAKWLQAPIGRGHFVMAMCLDRQNNLWVGEETGDASGGLYRFSAADGLWQRFTTKDGLGDDSIYALACDLQGRVWIGHLNHGITVFNGQKFQNYEVVAGLSKPDTLNGPLGERIFRIAVAPDFGTSGQKIENQKSKIENPPTFHDTLTDKDSPVAGSVWMASSAGLAIYFPATDTWSYLTRAEGLPSDQANAIAFANDGTVFIGHQCDGISIGSPADRYATWKQVTAAHPTPHPVDGKLVDSPVPTVGQGPGLPTDLINDLLVAKDGTVYAATTLGLAWSTDQGRTWQFVRGADWIDKVKNRFGGPPPNWQAPTDPNKGGAILAEDYTTTLAEDPDGNLLVGHRATEGDTLKAQAKGKVDSSAKVYVTSLVTMPGRKNTLRGTYGEGFARDKGEGPTAPVDPPIAASRTMPTSAKTPEMTLLQRLTKTSQASENASPTTRPATIASTRLAPKATGTPASQPAVTFNVPRAVFLRDDWATQGDWVMRYGRHFAVLCAANWPLDHFFTPDTYFNVVGAIDPTYASKDTIRRWLEMARSDQSRALYDPFFGHRREADWDDHGEAYAMTAEGPDLLLDVKVPAGLHRVSLYCVND
jgi:hypothetical protein